jgi:NADPH:quinone reductase-like Zn-dependent oxidoreductase
MKAAVVTAPGNLPEYGDFREPTAQEGLELITVTAAALSNLTKSRAAGTHYSADNQYPFVPGVDGVGTIAGGRRVYFAMPQAPFGAMAQRSLIDPRNTVALPNDLDDVTAAAIANPGMSCWAALVERAVLQSGETVLINGATGSSGTVAVQLAKYLGAKRVIATGRNALELEKLRDAGADVVVRFDLGAEPTEGVKQFEDALIAEFTSGIDIVIDYLWGTTARTIIVAIAKAVEEAHPVRFIQVGESSREPVELPAAALRSSAIQLMGSGLKSVPFPKLLDAIRHTFNIAAQGKLYLDTKAVQLSTIQETWNLSGKPRIVYTV